MEAFKSIFKVTELDIVSVCAWINRYVSNRFGELFLLYLSKVTMSQTKLDTIVNTVRGWLREIIYLPSITKSGVWDANSVIQIQESYGVMPIAVVSGKRKREETRKLTIQSLGEMVVSNYSCVLEKYQRLYFPNAKKYWLSAFPNSRFPLEATPSNSAMKAFMIFLMTHMELQLQKEGKRDANYYPYYTLAKPKHFDRQSYFSKFLVFILVNRGMRFSSGFKTEFLLCNQLPRRFYLLILVILLKLSRSQ